MVLDVLIGGEVGPSLALVVLGEELAGGAAAAVPRGSFGGCEVSGGVWAAVDKSDGVTEAVVTVTEAVVTVRGVEFVEVRGGKRGTSALQENQNQSRHTVSMLHVARAPEIIWFNFIHI